jgi:uncharacterized protein YutE (UPF0331/DUF86 family)
MTHIEPFENGTHSLAEALKSFKAFHDDSNNVFALKDAILRSHHALETLFKSLLLHLKFSPYQLDRVLHLSSDWVLLLNEKIEVKQILDIYENLIKDKTSTPFESERTIGLVTTIQRLRKLKSLEFIEDSSFQRFLGSIRELEDFRNMLQHYGLDVDPEAVGRILGNVIPQSYDILMISYSDLSSELLKLYPEANQVLDLLRYEYDILIREAVKFFRGRSFSKKSLNLTIEDHGHIGAPPYFPELIMNGFLQARWDHRSLLDWEIDTRLKSLGIQPYSAEIKISKPVIVKNLPFPPDYKYVTGRLDFHANLHYPIAEGLLNLPESSQWLAFLRQVSLDITAWLDYETEALFTGHHYDVTNLCSAKGSLEVQLIANSKGFTASNQPEITGRYNAVLDHNNAPFRFHSFVAPDGELEENHMFEWRINTLSDFLFS